MVSVFFVVLMLACGAAFTRGLRLPLNVARLAGLAVLTAWCARLGAPPLLSSACLVAGAIAGIAILTVSARKATRSAARWRLPLIVLAISAAIPALMLGSAFAGIEA